MQYQIGCQCGFAAVGGTHQCRSEGMWEVRFIFIQLLHWFMEALVGIGQRCYFVRLCTKTPSTWCLCGTEAYLPRDWSSSRQTVALGVKPRLSSLCSFVMLCTSWVCILVRACQTQSRQHKRWTIYTKHSREWPTPQLKRYLQDDQHYNSRDIYKENSWVRSSSRGLGQSSTGRGCHRQEESNQTGVAHQLHLTRDCWQKARIFYQEKTLVALLHLCQYFQGLDEHCIHPFHPNKHQNTRKSGTWLVKTEQVTRVHSCV